MDPRECKVGDKVLLWITGEITHYVAECTATADDPQDVPADLIHDTPRFKVTGIRGQDGSVTPHSLPLGMILKPGDYIVLEKL